VSLRPEYPDALNNLGVSLSVSGETPTRRRDSSLHPCGPNFDQAYLNLARLYVILEEKQRQRGVAGTAAPTTAARDGPEKNWKCYSDFARSAMRAYAEADRNDIGLPFSIHPGSRLAGEVVESLRWP